MSNGSVDFKTPLGYATAAITVLGVLGLTISILFNLSYLTNIGSRSIFLMTFPDYVSMSIAIIPLFAVPFVMVVYFCLYSAISIALPQYVIRWIDENPKLRLAVFPLMSIMIFTAAFLTIPREIAVLLMPLFMIPFFMPYVPLPSGLRKVPQWTSSPFGLHATVALLYLSLFAYMLWRHELRVVLPVAALLILIEVLILWSTWRQLTTMLTTTITLLHFANISIFSAILGGVVFADADKTLRHHVMVSVRDFTVHTAGGPQSFSYYTLENMILLRGMERGLLLWDTSNEETVFVPWNNILSMRERVAN